MPDVTAIIPVAPYHRNMYHRAIESVEAQTTPCLTLHMFDDNQEGPGVLRNRMLSAVTTPLVIFLDADDWIDKTYIAKCTAAIQPAKYVYTDWVTGYDWRMAPARPFCNKTWHPITCLLWTHDVRAIGGFDETLPAHEDTDFFLKLTTNKICGIHVPEPLFHYGKEGKRAIWSRRSGTEEKVKIILEERYRNKMGCCGQQDNVNQTLPLGVRQQGDVLAQAQWRGNRQEYGRATGRRYPRLSYPRTTWVHPEDVKISPNLWQAVPDRNNGHYQLTLEKPPLADQIVGAKPKPVRSVPVEDTLLTSPPPDGFSPNVDYVMEVAKKKLMG